MSDLPREILEDLPTQRFQENTARALKKNAASQELANTNLNNSINALQLSLTDLQTQVNTIPAITYEDHTVTISGTNSATISHSLGSVPSGWTIIDKVSGGGTPGFDLTRTVWSSSSITLSQYDFGSGSGCTYKIRIYK